MKQEKAINHISQAVADIQAELEKDRPNFNRILARTGDVKLWAESYLAGPRTGWIKKALLVVARLQG